MPESRTLDATRRYRVLAAEDDPQLRLMLEDALSHDGFDACCVPDGLAARETFASSGPYDVLLLDDRMPHMSGRQLLHTLREAGEAVPALILSGNCDLDDEERASLSPVAVLRKPARLQDISRALREVVEAG